MSTLHLTLKKRWFDMISSGEKKEEYREIKPYWIKRFLPNYKKAFFVSTGEYYETSYNLKSGIIYTLERYNLKKYDFVEFRNGYSKNSPTITLEFKGFEIREGNPYWGAIPGEKYFVIKLGEIINEFKL